MTCPRCGASLVLVGRVHRCVPRQPDGSGVTHKAVTHKEPVTHASVTHTGRSPGAVRQAQYHAKDPDGYRQRHREYMRKRRAAKQ